MRLYRRMRRVEIGILSVYNWSAVAAHTQNSYKQNAELQNSQNPAIFQEDGHRITGDHAFPRSPSQLLSHMKVSVLTSPVARSH